MLAVAVVLGYAQWRRLHLVQEVKELNAIGTKTYSYADTTMQVPTFNTIKLSGGWWPVVQPQTVQVGVKLEDFGKIVLVGGTRYPVGVAPGVVADLRRRLVAIGIDDVTVHVQGAIYNYEAAEKIQSAR